MATIQSLSQKTLRNASFTLVGYILPIVFSISITPVVVHRLGVENYGVYVFINALIGFLGLLDLGVAAALIKYIAEYQAQADGVERIHRLLRSACTLYLGIGLFGFVILVLIGRFCLPFFHVGAASDHSLFTVFLLAGMVFVVNTGGQVYAVILVALQRYDIATKLNLLYLTLFNGGLLLLVLMNHSLASIFGWYFVSALTLVAMNRYFARRALPFWRARFGWDVGEVRKAYSFGIHAAVTNLASSSLFQLDRFLIPLFLGPVSLTFYTLPGNVAQKVSGIGGSITQVLFPLSSSLMGSGEQEKIGQVYRRTVQNLAVLAAAGALACCVLAYPILHYWVGEEFAREGWRILIILVLTHYILALYGPLSFSLLGMGRTRFLMRLSIFLAVFNALLLMALVPHYKIEGAAWAFLLGVLPIPCMSVWVEKNIFKLPSPGIFYRRLYGKILLTALLCAPVAYLLFRPLVTSLLTLLCIGPFIVLLYLLLYMLFGFVSPEDMIVFRRYRSRFTSVLVRSPEKI